MDRDDWRDEPEAGYQRLAPGRTVRLRFGPCITVGDGAGDVIARDAEGRVTALRAIVVPGTAGGANPPDLKVHGVIHWVDAATSVRAGGMRACTIRLFAVAEAGRRRRRFHRRTCRRARSADRARRARRGVARRRRAIGTRFAARARRLLRVDEDSRPSALVLNRITTLRDERKAAYITSGQSPPPPAVYEKNAKAKTRPKLKSPREYREEARVRDPELARLHDAFVAHGLTAEQADLLSGDRATAEKGGSRAAGANHRELAAKWLINEPPRRSATMSSRHSRPRRDPAERVALLARLQAISPDRGANVRSQMVATGARSPDLKQGRWSATGGVGFDDRDVDRGDRRDPRQGRAGYKAGKIGLLGFFVGQVMKASPNADAARVKH